jgi:2-polyprenyl-3-methyl-5-hydroxy-6-metoxy-1,4-benzoquinol methylase
MPPVNPAPLAPLIAVVPATCGLCGSDKHRPYATSQDYEYGTCRNSWTFVECLECRTVYLNPRPAPDTLSTIYPANYYAYNYDQRINAVARWAKERLDRRMLAWVVQQLGRPLRSYCDVGCGNGRYLEAMARSGVPRDRIYGVELDDTVVARLCAAGFRVECATIETARTLPDGGLDLMTLFSVLEHVSEPRAILGRAAALLAPGGLFVAEVPNLRSLNGRLFRDRYWGGYHTPRHWNLFTIEALTAAAERVGLRVKTFRRTTGHAFWLYSLHHYLRYERQWDRLGKMLHPATCLPGVAVATAVDLVRARLGGETDNMLVVIERPGH